MIGFRKKRTKESEIQEQSSEKQEEAVSAREADGANGLRLDVISPVPPASLWMQRLYGSDWSNGSDWSDWSNRSDGSRRSDRSNRPDRPDGSGRSDRSNCSVNICTTRKLP